MRGYYIAIVILFILVLLFIKVFLRYKKEIAASLQSLEGKSQVIQTKSGQIEYRIEGQGYPVLISHGGAGGFDQGMITAHSHLHGKHAIISVSRFGHLRTPLAEDSSAVTQADAYAHLLEALDIPGAAIIGSSGGVPSAIQFAQRHPDKCAALICSSGVSMYLPERPLSIYKNDFIYWMATTYLRPLSLEKIGVTKDIQNNLSDYETQYLGELFKSMHPISLRRSGLFQDVHEWADAERWKQDYQLERITVPTLVIHAINDVVIPFSHGENTAGGIPNAELLSLPGGGHLKLKHFDTIRERVSDFIDTHH